MESSIGKTIDFSFFNYKFQDPGRKLINYFLDTFMQKSKPNKNSGGSEILHLLAR